MTRTFCLWALLVLALSLPLEAEEGQYTVVQADLEETIRPLEGDVSAEEFYDYDEDARRSQNPLVENLNSFLFLYEDPDGQVYLFIIHGPNEQEVFEIEAEFRIADVPLGAEWIVQDNPPDVRPFDEYDLEGERAHWTWGGWFRHYDTTAGGVLGPLGEEFEIEVTPEIFPGVQNLYLLTGDVDAPERYELNRQDTITIVGPEIVPVVDPEAPEARFALEPVTPRPREEVVFDAAESEPAPDLHIEEYHWVFGDGAEATTTEPQVRHTYMEAGAYEVSLTVVDSEGRASAELTQLIDVTEVVISAERSISTEEATPGSIFRVSVRIRGEQELSGAGLQESLPTGWEIVPIESAGAEYNERNTQWVFTDPIRDGVEPVITYDVIVPEAEDLTALRLPHTVHIEGIFQAKTPDFEIEVEGESRVIITDCLPVKTAIAHLLRGSQQGKNDRVDLRLSEVITARQLERAGELWRKDEPVVGTCGERISLSTLKELTAHAKECVPVDRPLSDMPAPDLQAVRTIVTPVPCEGVVLGFHDTNGDPIGNVFTVEVEITTDVDVLGVGLDEHLPNGWRVTPVQDDGFLYNPARNQWALMDALKGGGSRTIIYTVEVPPSAAIEAPPAGDCVARAAESVVGWADTGWPCVEVAVRGDSRVELTDCLDVIVAISRWDVEEDRIDLMRSDRITFDQVQRAVAFWLEGEEVPRTCPPSTVDYETLKLIISMWQTGTPLCKDLPETTPGVCD
ncbi:MAG: PKD domain-containing protein [Candidatus Bipolaricaulota bacterium]